MTALVGALAICLLPGAAQAASPEAVATAKKKKGKKKKPKPVVVKAMTRNVYLGSSLAGGLNAANFPELCDGAREVITDVDQSLPQTRMTAVANEIRSRLPDLVGLQEVAAWYVQTPGDGRPAGPPLFGDGTVATTVRFDFLNLIMNRLNQGKKRYKVVSVSNEFEFETELDMDGDDGTDSPAPDCTDAESDGRMLMRDVILARVGAGVVTSKPKKGNFVNQLALNVAGFPFPVKRGWEAVDVRVRGSQKFRFVNTHLEAFDSNATTNSMYNTVTTNMTTVSRGTVRKTQAQEVLNGPAKAPMPVVLVGDLNSNIPEVQVGDGQAFQAVLARGFLRRSTQNPASCCADVETGVIGEFDHVVDHILTNRKFIKGAGSTVFGRAKIGGRYPSDHAGVMSKLKVPKPAKKGKR